MNLEKISANVVEIIIHDDERHFVVMHVKDDRVEHLFRNLVLHSMFRYLGRIIIEVK